MAGWHHQCNGCELGQTSKDSKGGRPVVLQFMRSQIVGHDWETEQPQNGYCQNYFSNSPLMTQYLFVLVKAIDLTLSFGKIRMT